MPTRDEIHAAFSKGEQAIVDLFDAVDNQVKGLANQLDKPNEAIKELQARLSKDSHNSSKPPSSDGYGKKPRQRRTESLRQKGQKPNGGQPGHKGQTLIASENPDQTAVHEVEQCERCCVPLKEVEAEAIEERQVFDIPARRIEVTAHRAEIKICPACGHENQGQFPEGINQTVQYGNGVKAWASYFSNQHFIPVERTAQIFEDLLNHRVSEATVLKASEELSECVSPATEAVKEPLQNSEVLNLDESGLRVKSKLHWLHVASTEKLTHYEVHAKRGTDAMEAAGILTDFKGTATPDHWKPYFKYEDCGHALCNAHHLRELKFIEKQYQQTWSKKMAALLLEIKEAVAETQENQLTPLQIETFERQYDDIVNEGFEANPRSPPETFEAKKRGPPKQTPPVNLLIRLRDFKPQVLAFMYDQREPFDNNQAERDIRMVKVKQKVSGCFRTLEGAERFGRVRGYIGTARKKAKNVFEAIKEAFKGIPFIPSL
ncbi:transposase IS66 [Candidatus Thiomargarita nelsonii]|uniref:Transposase IS66 n=1 Tax=Candidatus Thiomargarita nelsonii TaxID=1003181 RepID=A0A0A6P0M6_9GAMM|nr:transposase IS66 [Candidatus Thiomargarita nelsonii]